MTFPAQRDTAHISVVAVARELLGAEDPARSTSQERHFKGHRGLFVNIIKNKWYSHGKETGGGAADLVCFVTGCDFSAAVAWLRSRGFIHQQPAPKQNRVVCIYDYCDETGVVLYHVGRLEPKRFFQWREIDGERINGVSAGLYERSTIGGSWRRVKNRPRLGTEVREFPGIRPVPYRLPELLRSGDAPILVSGGEKDVDNLCALGFTATCNHGGEGKWWDGLSQWFEGRRVRILSDNDEQGQKHQATVGAALSGVAREIRVVRFPELPAQADVSDLIELRRKAGHDDLAIKQELAERFHSAPAWERLSQVVVNDEWREPVLLPEGLSPVDVFDTALLPSKIAPWVRDISERMQCPPDYVGAPALIALGSVLGRKIGIAPEQKTDWYEVANLWGCLVGRPGIMKSPSVAEALKPLHRLEVDARKEFDERRAEHDKAHYEWRLRKDAAEQLAKAALKKDPSAPLVKNENPEPLEPTEHRYVTNDTSYEKLGELLAQNPNGILAYRDELVSLLKTLDREEYAASRGFYLTAWNGKDRYTFDRITRGKTHIEAACVSLLGSTQPGRLAEYVHSAISGGARDDGLIQRFGLLVWPDQSPQWESVDRYPNSEARQTAWKCFDSFDSLDPARIGAEPASIHQSVPVLRLDAEAHGLFLEWRTDLEHLLRSDGLHPALESHFAKYRKLVPALALINHLADVGYGPVGKKAMLAALGLAKYLESHARRAYGAGPEAETAAAKAILSHIRKGHLADGFSARDVHRPRWSNLSDRSQVQAGLDLLCDLDWLAAAEKRSPRGGRPSPQYRINPRAMK